jgi:hypothetical protein
MSPEDALKLQIEAYRRMTPEQRTRLGFELSEFACQMSREGFLSQHPDASPDEVDRELRRRLELTRA